MIRRCSGCGLHKRHNAFTSKGTVCRKCRNGQASPPSTKLCSRCGVSKSITDFPPRPGRVWAGSRCRECLRDLQGPRNAANATRNRERHLIQRYGMTLDAFENRLLSQGGGCAICGGPPVNAGRAGSTFHVDHCHTTGAIRGLLCSRCNRAIGLIRDDANLADGIARYLRSTHAS